MPQVPPQIPQPIDILEVPSVVTSPHEALGAIIWCTRVCERLLERSTQGTTNSRLALQHQALSLYARLFTETLPMPVLGDHGWRESGLDAPVTGGHGCIWVRPVAHSLQLRLLECIFGTCYRYCNIWQDIDDPPRYMEGERSVVAICALAIFDVVLRILTLTRIFDVVQGPTESAPSSSPGPSLDFEPSCGTQDPSHRHCVHHDTAALRGGGRGPLLPSPAQGFRSLSRGATYSTSCRPPQWRSQTLVKTWSNP